MTFGPNTARIPFPLELWVATVAVMVIPLSMETPWGAAGSYVCLIVTLLAASAILRMRPRKEELKGSIPTLFIAIIVLSTAVALLRDDSLSLATLRGTPVQMSAFFSVLIFARIWASRGGSLRKWIESMIWLSLAVSLVACAEYLMKSYLEVDRFYSAVSGIAFDDSAFRTGPDMFRAVSTAGNPLILGTFAAVWGCCAFGVYLSRPKLIYFFAVGVHAAAVFSSLSRSSWIALAVGIVLMLACVPLAKLRLSKRHLLHALMLMMVASALLLLQPVQDELFRGAAYIGSQASLRMAGTERSISYTHRVTSPQSALSSMLSQPETLLVGFGLGAENRYFLASNPILDQPIAVEATRLRTFDNTYVTIVYSFGLIGLLLFAFYFYRTFQRISHEDKILGIPQLGGTVALAVCIFFYNGLSSPMIALYLGMFLGAAGTSIPLRNSLARSSGDADDVPTLRSESKVRQRRAATSVARPSAFGP